MPIQVFVFDDDELIRTTLGYFLKQEGFLVSEFAQPDHCSLYYDNDCLCQAKSACADIIITDINMPGENGLQFVENQIKKGCKIEHVAVMSGDWEDPFLKKAQQLGCRVFYKPFSIIEMKQWLDEIRKDFMEEPVNPALPIYANKVNNKSLVKKHSRSSKSKTLPAAPKSSQS
jgi:DNA-binding NarL/FixJ family response regulator